MTYEIKTLPLSAIRTNGGTQTRVQLNAAAVKEYGEAMTEGVHFPPVIVFFDGTDHWLADGFHRVQASMDIGALSIEAEVRPGDRRDAVLFSAGANGAHGVQRTNEDKRRAVRVLLDDAEWAKWSDRQIAQACGVTHPFVSALRRPEVAEQQKQARNKSAAKKVESDSTQACGQVESGAPQACGQVESDSTTAAGRSLDSESSEAATAPDESARQPGPVKATKPAEPEDIEATRASLAEQQARVSEVIDQFAQLQAEALEYGKIFDADDKLAEARSCIKRQAAEILVLRSRLEGLMNEKNEAVSAAKAWRRKHDALEKRLKVDAS